MSVVQVRLERPFHFRLREEALSATRLSKWQQRMTAVLSMTSRGRTFSPISPSFAQPLILPPRLALPALAQTWTSIIQQSA